MHALTPLLCTPAHLLCTLCSIDYCSSHPAIRRPAREEFSSIEGFFYLQSKKFFKQSYSTRSQQAILVIIVSSIESYMQSHLTHLRRQREPKENPSRSYESSRSRRLWSRTLWSIILHTMQIEILFFDIEDS